MTLIQKRPEDKDVPDAAKGADESIGIIFDTRKQETCRISDLVILLRKFGPKFWRFCQLKN